MPPFSHTLRIIGSLIIVLWGTISCKIQPEELGIKTEAEIVIPFFQGSFTLGNLFYDIEQSNELSLETGVFYTLSSNVPFDLPDGSLFTKEVELVFNATNLMPFQLDMSITPFDSINNENTAEPIITTLVEAAWVETDGLSIEAVMSENSLVFDQEIFQQLEASNSLLIELYFIWPYESITTSMIDDYYSMYAFRLVATLKIKW